MAMPKVALRFDPPLADIRLEQGSKNQIWALFRESHSAWLGRQRVEATLTVSSEIQIRPTLGNALVSGVRLTGRGTQLTIAPPPWIFPS